MQNLIDLNCMVSVNDILKSQRLLAEKDAEIERLRDALKRIVDERDFSASEKAILIAKEALAGGE